MNQAKSLTVSIVIPVYNEADQLVACLQAIAAQTVRPLEVIVVDNNSNDSSSTVAESFGFVKIVREQRQGVVHARDRGFDAASGDIIGRIDADTRLSPDWVEAIQQLFVDESLAAVSGSVDYHDLPRRDINAKLDLFFRRRIASGMEGEVFLYGANMAVRRSVWQAVRTEVCHDAGLHEDFDLAIHTQALGFRAKFDRRLKASVSLRRFDSQLVELWPYLWQSPRTYARHGLKSQRNMYPVIVLVIAFYVPLKLLHRGYNAETGQFSLRQAVSPSSQVRVNPALFID
ncbi:MAG TPA: glycosyltransferase family 2 protein [Candidatus Saccharimonadales bacterium]|nr:glycosyltransferase family 2 protein [Candidatus Saccharimonadales bacterium]